LALALVASTNWSVYWDWTIAALLAAAGLGFIIFVHELGHFAVAKWCGVKCDKFMIGFDIGGWKISRQWGETTYGIGILPLGGYVKMMGQDDDPRVTTEQVEQSLAREEGIPTKEITGPGGEKYLVDARSYLAKTVPQRMAIISAGVIMNIIFAFIFATIAFMVGVPTPECVVGATVPGSPAWENGLRPGDKITRIGDITDPLFDDLKREVSLARSQQVLNFTVRRTGGDEIELKLTPDRSGKLPAIGITNSATLALDDKRPTAEHTPAGSLESRIPGGATIVSVDGSPVDSYDDFQRLLYERRRDPLQITLQPAARKPDAPPEPTVTVTLPANSRESLGLAVGAGAIVAVEKNSPAVQAGLVEGDLILSIDGLSLLATDDQPAQLDPLRIDAYLTSRDDPTQPIELAVARGGNREKTETFSLAPRNVSWLETPLGTRDPIAISSLGVAVPLVPRVSMVEPGGPADKAGVQVGDSIDSVVQIVPQDGGQPKRLAKIDFQKNPRAWGVVDQALQDREPGVAMELTLARSGSEQPIVATIEPQPVDDQFSVPRGLVFKPLLKDRIGSNLSEQMAMGFDETVSAMTSVYRFLARLTGGDISPTLMGGPIMIAQGAASTAKSDWGTFLLFLTLISANLAVVNFLPIPVLDGGHMVFLIYEGITGRPANDTVVTVMSLIGLVLILSLMVWVFSLDIGRLFGWE
jgi:regulator of sigma E protease